MKLSTIIWAIIILLGLGFVVSRAMFTDVGMGKAYVEQEQITFVNVAPDGEEANWINVDLDEALDYAIDLDNTADEDVISWTQQSAASQKAYAVANNEDGSQTQFAFSWARTLGVWVAAFFTLAIFSFLYADNPFYKIAEAVVVGVSAAYWMVTGFWDTLVPNLIGKLSPGTIRAWAVPGTSESATTEWFYLIPLVLGVMLLWRLAPKGGWISRWPMAFIIGVFCGLRLISFIHADFLSQIRNTVVPLYVNGPDGFAFWDTFKNALLIIGVLTCLVYFFFSIEHKGAVGHTARVGIWFLMVTFGAAFGYTVMGRIALLAIRLEFLFDDWLWLIDPTGKRIDEAIAIIGYVPNLLPMIT